jgi:FtsZ-binding cell division protein ZapB
MSDRDEWIEENLRLRQENGKFRAKIERLRRENEQLIAAIRDIRAVAGGIFQKASN